MVMNGRFVLVFVVLMATLLTACSKSRESSDASSTDPKFVNVTNEVGFIGISDNGEACAWGDVNSDGLLDIFLGNFDGYEPTHKLFRNTGTVFEDITQGSGIPYDQIIRSSTWADYDNDGKPDLLIATILAPSFPILLKNIDGTKFKDVSESAGITKKGTIFHAIWGDYNNDGFIDILQVNLGPRPYLYKNNGDGTFSEVSESAGLGVERANSAIWFDYNNDGFLDIYFANGGENSLYKNNGDGTFTKIQDAGGASGDKRWRTSGVCSGDYNNDGYIDIYISNISSQRNALYRNNGDGTFSDVTEKTGTADVGDGRTCAFVDFNNDGFLDIFTTNHTQPNRLYKNDGKGKFVDVASKVGIAIPIIDVFGASWGDYNGDAFMDVFLTGHIGVGLLKNTTNTNRGVVIRLEGNGKTTNASAIGSRVTLKTDSLTQVREVSGGRGNCEQDMLPVHFGLGKAKKAHISVRWTDGSECTFNDVDLKNDTTITIKQKGCELVRK